MRSVSPLGYGLGVFNTSTTAWATSSQLLHLTSAECTIFAIPPGDKCYVRNFSDRRSPTAGRRIPSMFGKALAPHHKSSRWVVKAFERSRDLTCRHAQGKGDGRLSKECTMSPGQQGAVAGRLGGGGGSGLCQIRRLGNCLRREVLPPR
jgi:hypothetical protein